MRPVCFFAGRPGAGPCDGALIRGHLIPKQVIRREVMSARRGAGALGQWPVGVDQRAELSRILWDERAWVPMCGGLTGCSGHHGALDTARTLRIRRDELPAAVEEFAAEHGLEWWLGREYGPRAAAA